MLAEVKKELQKSPEKRAKRKPAKKPATKHRKKPERKFSSFFLRYVVVHVVVVSLALGCLWEWLREYELCNPDRVAQAAAESISQGDLSLLENSIKADSFDSKEVLLQKASEYLQGKQLSTRMQAQGEYLFLADDKEFATMKMQPSGQKTLFGLEKQHVTQVDLLHSFQTKYTIIAPQNAQITVNGVALDQSYRTDQQPVSGYRDLPEQFQPALLNTYVVESAQEPTVQAALNGQACRIEQTEKGIEVVGEVSQQDKDLLTETAGEVAQLYSQFITQDATFSQLRGYFIPETEFYDSLATFYNPWYVTHDSYHYETEKCDDFRQYNEEQISCMLQFKYEVYRGSKVHDFSGKYRVYFQKDGEEWKVAMLEVM